MKRPSSRLPLLLGFISLSMVGASFAAVPFYTWFCRTTGFAGTTAVSTATPDRILDRTIKIHFDATSGSSMPWEFKPVEREMVLRVGEVGLAFYEAHNPTDRVIAGTATYNVAPEVAGGFFTKIECFCFTQQVLQPGERVMMPVSFYVDPSIDDHIDGKSIKAITLGYTFYETELPEKQAALQVAGSDSTQAVAN